MYTIPYFAFTDRRSSTLRKALKKCAALLIWSRVPENLKKASPTDILTLLNKMTVCTGGSAKPAVDVFRDVKCESPGQHLIAPTAKKFLSVLETLNKNNSSHVLAFFCPAIRSSCLFTLY